MIPPVEKDHKPADADRLKPDESVTSDAKNLEKINETIVKQSVQADRILMEQIPLIPLFYGRLHFLVKPWVRNLHLAPTWEVFWKDVIIEPH